MDLIFIPILWLLFALFSALIASSKNRSAFGWFLIGLFFGPFGLLVAALPAAEASDGLVDDLASGYGEPVGPAATSRKCPFCAETIKAEAVVCRFCSRDLPVSPVTDAELLQAAFNGNAEAVKSCLDRGADVNSRNNNGATPLFLAAFQNRPDLVQLLLERGADSTIANNGGKAPREVAAREGHNGIVALL